MISQSFLKFQIFKGPLPLTLPQGGGKYFGVMEEDKTFLHHPKPRLRVHPGMIPERVCPSIETGQDEGFILSCLINKSQDFMRVLPGEISCKSKGAHETELLVTGRIGVDGLVHTDMDQGRFA